MTGVENFVLRARGLTKSFGSHRAVDGVDLTVQAGEAVALLGPNGAGKTTTLFMLVGVVTPDAGVVEIVGRKLPEDRSQAMAQVGFTAGYLPIPARLKVREFLHIYGELYGLPDARPHVHAGLERFGISHLAENRGLELSSGQRTLVGVVKATLHRPKLLVLDEPTASLDPEVARRVHEGLRRLREDHTCAILITTHDMVEVERLCDRVVFLSRGSVVADGSPADVARRFDRHDLEGVFLHLAQADAHTEGPSGPSERAKEGAS